MSCFVLNITFVERSQGGGRIGRGRINSLSNFNLQHTVHSILGVHGLRFGPDKDANTPSPPPPFGRNATAAAQFTVGWNAPARLATGTLPCPPGTKQPFSLGLGPALPLETLRLGQERD